MQRTVLILTAHTGGGHDSVATALEQALVACGASCTLPCVAAPLGPAVDRIYGLMLNHAARLWGLCYVATDTAPANALGRRFLRACRGSSLAALLREQRPDLILSVHPLCAQLAASALHQLRLDIPHHCVITDLVTVHRAWVAPAIATYYVPTTLARETLLRHGVAADRVLLTGLPVRRVFWSIARRGAVPGTLGPSPFRVLAMDGGQPGPSLARMARILLGQDVPLALSLAWGNSRPAPVAVRHRLHAVRHLSPGACIAAEMTAADLVVTKAGSVSIAEALAIGRPILLHRVVPGQEEGNPGYLQAAGAGCAALTGAEICAQVRRLAAAPRALDRMAACARNLGRPAAALAVARHVLATLGEPVAPAAVSRPRPAAYPERTIRQQSGNKSSVRWLR